ncbi:MAG: chalcone isomerase family protein [Polaromonas sp.]|nr:chalcone isomerase family protein [Polaromonas sp.]
MTPRQVLLLVSCAAVAGSVQAQSLESRTEALSVSPANPQDVRSELVTALPLSRLVGKGRLTFWGFQVYDARLWALPDFKPDNFPAQPFALELAYLRGFDNQDVAERSITEMRRSAAISDVQAKTWIAEMMRVLPDVKTGDRVMGIHRPGSGAQFLVNGKQSGEIRDAEFARLFFGIWLSPKTSEPKLRSALLSGVG